MEYKTTLELVVLAIKNTGQIHWDALAELDKRAEAEKAQLIGEES